MKTRNLITLLLSAFTHSVFTANASDDNNVFIDNALADPFFSNMKVTLGLKNYWKYLKEDIANPKEVHNAWGQGFSLDYQSGYFADVIGVDATWYGAVKLGASDYFNSRGVLYNNGGGNLKSNADGFSKIGQRNIKLKYAFSDAQLNARWGWQTIKNLGVISNSTRLSPTTYLGWTGAINYDAFTLRGAWVESAMERNSPDKQHFTTNTGKIIDHIVSGDIRWDGDSASLLYGYGESDSYLRRHLFFGSIMPDKRLTLGVQIYGNEALEQYKVMPASKRDFDERAWHYAIEAKWQADNWSTKWGLGYTRAHKDNAVGFYPRHMSKNSRGTFSSMAYAGDDYLRHKELMLATITDYNLTPDFAVGLAGNVGQFNYQNNHVRTGEISLFTRWVPVHPKLKNLTIWTLSGPGWSYKASGKTPILTDGHYSRAHTLSSEVIIEYKFSL